MRARRLLLAACLAAALGATSAAAQETAHGSAGETPPIEARIREAVGTYGFVCAGGVQLAVFIVFVLARGRPGRAR